VDVISVIDVEPLRRGGKEAPAVAEAIDAGCRGQRFFSVVGHGIDPALWEGLADLAREFFARPETEKAVIAMAKSGAAWRGWFPLGAELTAGTPDDKEGLYFGTELGQVLLGGMARGVSWTRRGSRKI
jgi:isopenicillin N synthase-like dioxygenase